MKKILSLIGALTLVGTTSATAIACTSATNNAAQTLINKINDASIQITAPLQSQQETTKAREALMQNSSITQQEADELTFSGALEFEASKPVTVIAHVGSQTAVGKINVTLHNPNPTPPPVNPAQALINKINNAEITVPSGTPAAITNPQTVTAIKTALKAAKGITDLEAQELSFSGGPLVDKTQVAIDVTATVSGQTANGSIKVTLPGGSQAQTLLDKIVHKKVNLPAAIP